MSERIGAFLVWLVNLWLRSGSGLFVDNHVCGAMVNWGAAVCWSYPKGTIALRVHKRNILNGTF